MTADGITRRELLAAATGAVVVAGYDTLARRWVGVAEAASCVRSTGAPQLDGKLLLDAASRTARSDRPREHGLPHAGGRPATGVGARHPGDGALLPALRDQGRRPRRAPHDPRARPDRRARHRDARAEHDPLDRAGRRRRRRGRAVARPHQGGVREGAASSRPHRVHGPVGRRRAVGRRLPGLQQRGRDRRQRARADRRHRQGRSRPLLGDPQPRPVRGRARRPRPVLDHRPRAPRPRARQADGPPVPAALRRPEGVLEGLPHACSPRRVQRRLQRLHAAGLERLRLPDQRDGLLRSGRPARQRAPHARPHAAGDRGRPARPALRHVHAVRRHPGRGAAAHAGGTSSSSRGSTSGCPSPRPRPTSPTSSRTSSRRTSRPRASSCSSRSAARSSRGRSCACRRPSSASGSTSSTSSTPRRSRARTPPSPARCSTATAAGSTARASSARTRYPIGSLDFDREDWKRHYGDQWPRLQEDQAPLRPRQHPHAGSGWSLASATARTAALRPSPSAGPARARRPRRRAGSCRAPGACPTRRTP